MDEEQASAEKTSRSTATLLAGLAVAAVGWVVKAFGEGAMDAADTIAGITGGPADSAGTLAYLLGIGVIAVGGLMVAAAVVWKLIDWLSGD